MSDERQSTVGIALMKETGYSNIYIYAYIHMDKYHIGSGGKQSRPWRKWNIEVHLWHSHFDEALSGLGESEQDSASGAYASFGGPLERILTRLMTSSISSNHLREFCWGPLKYQSGNYASNLFV